MLLFKGGKSRGEIHLNLKYDNRKFRQTISELIQIIEDLNSWNGHNYWDVTAESGQNMS